MKSFETIPVLNRLLQIVCRSLAMYLADARPWTEREGQSLQAMLDNLAADDRRYAQRLCETVEELGGCPDRGRFPTEFTAKNDLALEFLLQELICEQERDVARIDHCVVQLAGVPALHALAEEIYGNACGHLETLQEAFQAKP